MRSPFILNVADLAAPGSTRVEHLEVGVDWSLEMSRVEEDPPLRADLVLHSLTGGILVRGTITVAARHACHRCLTEFVEQHDVAASAMFMPEPDEDSYPLHGDEIDVEQMLRDEVLLGMPLLPRCDIDCPGVVSNTATDLNTITVGDDEDLSGSPFAVLRDLLGPGT
jgi:uncharacterized protein